MRNFAAVTIMFLQCFALFDKTWGHGMLLDPVNRSSRWRYDPSAPANYDDNEHFCGGLIVHQIQNGGKCGICGDNYRKPTPRDNELGGKYGGNGVIVRTYGKTNTADVKFMIENNHLGHVHFELCNLDEFENESEECFAKYRLKFADGTDKFEVGTQTGILSATIALPNNVSCKHCVLRWNYVGGNNWNPCAGGGGAMGCGPQETFKNCADISINAA